MLDRLQAVSDVLLEKAEEFVKNLEPEQVDAHILKQLTGMLKDLQGLRPPQEEAPPELVVRFEGAEQKWMQ